MKTNTKATFLRQFVSAFGLGLAVVLILLILWIGANSIFFINRIFPGVTLNGTALGGMTEEEATQAISAGYSFPQTGHILLQSNDQSWMVSPAQLGVYVNAQATAEEAIKIGRSNPFVILQAEFFGYTVSPTFIFDQSIALQYLEGLSASIDQPVKEASLSIQGADVNVVQGQPGRAIDLAASLAALSKQIQKMQDGAVQLAITEVQPKVLDVSQQGDQVKAILSQPLTLTLPADANNPAVGPWTISPADLAGLLSLKESQDNQTTTLAVEINQPLMVAYLKTLEKKIDQAPLNSRFTFNDGTGQLDLIQKAVVGRTLDAEKSATAINDALLKGEHSVALSLDVTQPQVADDATGASLGITELVESYTSYFHGSSADRVQNIQTAAASFMGLLVAPGETVSMSDIIGEISLDNGYAEAPIILGDQTIQGVGGGVCQVSTTLFRTAFLAGYQIVERHPHAYRVKYYEQVNSAGQHDEKWAGLDATVFVPLVDFQFKNDSDHWLLMETYVNPSNYSLTWKFYSTQDGRTVDWQTTGPTDLKDPPAPVYVENPSLPTGTLNQTDWAVQGATVVVTRSVSRGGKIIDSDKFTTQYEPWPDMYEYGPGTPNIPTPTPAQ
jgi:Uncharacterized vancomycin resistance protein